MSWPEPDRSPSGPLAGLRVVDLSAFLPGPYCTALLAELGADVIKVEAPGGDPARHLPGGLYDIANRNKRGVVADLTDASARERCLQLVAGADVFVEGFRPGVAKRLGLDYPTVRVRRPSIVYCSISAFGQDGPKRDRPGHDITLLAAAGALSFSPHWTGPPRRSGVPIADLAASWQATIAILAALRERDRTGMGAHLDAALADAATSAIAPRGGPALTATDDDRVGVYPTNDVFRTRDGRSIAISAVEQKFWQRLRAAMVDVEPGLGDPGFDNPEDRHRTRGNELFGLLTAAFARRTLSEWLAIFEKADVCAEPVAALAEAVGDPQTAHRQIVRQVADQRHVIFPVHKDGVPMGRFDRLAPELGEHTSEVFGRI